MLLALSDPDNFWLFRLQTHVRLGVIFFLLNAFHLYMMLFSNPLVVSGLFLLFSMSNTQG